MKSYIYIILIICPFQIFCQELLPLDTCRKMAIEYNQDIKSAQAGFEAAGYDAKAIKTDLYPRIDFGSNYRYLSNGIDINGYETKDALEHIYNFKVGITQNIYSGSAVSKSHEIAQTQEIIASEEKRFTGAEIVLETDRTYWQVVADGELNNLAFRYRDIIQYLVNTILDKVEEEVLSKTEYLQAKVNLNEAELKVIQSGNNLRLSEMALNRLIGNEITTEIAIEDSIEVDFSLIDDIDYIQTALSTRPEIKIGENLVTVADLNVQLTKSPYMPTIGVGAFGKWGTPGQNLSTDPRFNYQVFGYLNMPLIYFGKKGKEVEASRIRNQIAHYQLDKTEDLVTLEVNQARYGLEESVRKVELTQNSVLQADENLELITDRYIEGLSPIIDVLNAQLFWESAYKDFVAAKKEFQINYSLYIKALGLNYIEP
ncbi:MAG: TolC family protein [Cyclobacteriaceae bacterium]|nr:TolC family protein [Cyclobacteriaceae bacterium]